MVGFEIGLKKVFPFEKFSNRFGVAPQDIFSKEIDELVTIQLIEIYQWMYPSDNKRNASRVTRYFLKFVN